MKVLLIDDCRDIGDLVKRSLEPYEVLQATTLAEGRRELESGLFDLLLIDIELPDGSGLDFCMDVCGTPQYEHIAKLFLTANDRPSSIVSGLTSGADDYMTKPFSIQELKARVDLRMKKHKDSRDFLLRAEPFELDCKFQKGYLTINGERRSLDLTPTEFRILLTLVRRAGDPVSRHEILDSIWKSHGLHIEAKSIDSHIAHLRKKLGDHGGVITTVYGRGYAYDPAVNVDRAS